MRQSAVEIAAAVRGGERKAVEVLDEALAAIKAAGPPSLTKAPPTVTVGKDATVTGLANVLGALAYFEVTSVTLVAPKP